MEGRLCLPPGAGVGRRLETNPRAWLLGGFASLGWEVAGLDGSCLSALLSWSPDRRESIPGAGKASLGRCAPHPGPSERTCDWEKGGREHSSAYPGGVGAAQVAHVFLLCAVHRSRDPPGHGLGERGFGGVALNPERGVCHHWLSAGQAAVPEPPSVHGNHVGTRCVPLPKPCGSCDVRTWKFSPSPWTCVRPVPAMAPFSLTHTHVPGLHVLSPLLPSFPGASNPPI